MNLKATLFRTKSMQQILRDGDAMSASWRAARREGDRAEEGEQGTARHGLGSSGMMT